VTDDATPASPPATPYDEFGGEEFFTRLVAGFYRRVATDPILRPMYPEDDLPGAERRLRMFLMQYWGGPGTYSEERGHPALRMRHSPYPIDAAARDRWLALMHESMTDMDLPDDQDAMLWRYLIGAAFAMQNVPDDFPPTGGSLGQVQA
jgi:hemoglobin